jgi:hypothetical protein
VLKNQPICPDNNKDYPLSPKLKKDIADLKLKRLSNKKKLNQTVG